VGFDDKPLLKVYRLLDTYHDTYGKKSDAVNWDLASQQLQTICADLKFDNRHL